MCKIFPLQTGISMSEDAFRIYVEQLRDGHREQIKEEVSSDFLDINEETLKFKDNVIIEGEAYLAGDMLILHLVVVAQPVIPCLICNEPVILEVRISDFYHAEPLDDIKSGVFDFRDLIREAILLETPAFAECEGSCPQRKEISKYLKDSEKVEEEGYNPFQDL